MKKLLLGLIATAGAWTSVSAEVIEGYVYHNPTETVTLNRADLDHVADGKWSYTNDFTKFTLAGNADIEYLGDNDKCLNLNHGTEFTFGWEATNPNCSISKVTNFTFKSACYMAGSVSVNGGSSQSIATSLFGFNKASDNNYKTITTSDENGLPNDLPIVFSGLGLTDQYICYISCTYTLEYYTLDFTEFDEVYKKAAIIYASLSPEDQQNSEFGKLYKAAGEFREANDGPIDVANGTKPAKVHEEAEKLRVLLLGANIPDNGDASLYIVNNSFEMGDLTGWTLHGTPAKNHGVRNDLPTGGQHGDWILNTWTASKTNATGTRATNPDFYEGFAVSQDIEGIPNGTYEVSALLCSWLGKETVNGNIQETKNTTWLTINGQKVTGVQCDTENTFTKATATVVVTDGRLTIGAVGGEKTIQGKKGSGSRANDGDVFTYNTWYRADNFQLKLIQADTYQLNEAVAFDVTGAAAGRVVRNVKMARTIKAGTWNTLCLPFSMDIPAGWEVKKLSGVTYNDGAYDAQFTTAESIEAGKPYIVKVKDAVSEIVPNNTGDITLVIAGSETVDDGNGHSLTFEGVFEPKELADCYFISGGKFYHAAAGAGNKTKAYRAIFTTTDAPAPSARLVFSFIEDGELTTIDANELMPTYEAPVFDLQGRRVNAPVSGQLYIKNGKKFVQQ